MFLLHKNEKVYDKKHIDKKLSSRAKQMEKDIVTELEVHDGRYLASAVDKLFKIKLMKNMHLKNLNFGHLQREQGFSVIKSLT